MAVLDLILGECHGFSENSFSTQQRWCFWQKGYLPNRSDFQFKLKNTFRLYKFNSTQDQRIIWHLSGFDKRPQYVQIIK